MCVVSGHGLGRLVLQVYVHGAHGTKCYILLRGLARVLMPEEDPDSPNPGAFRYRPVADLGPGDVSSRAQDARRRKHPKPRK